MGKSRQQGRKKNGGKLGKILGTNSEPDFLGVVMGQLSAKLETPSALTTIATYAIQRRNVSSLSNQGLLTKLNQLLTRDDAEIVSQTSQAIEKLSLIPEICPKLKIFLPNVKSLIKKNCNLEELLTFMWNLTGNLEEEFLEGIWSEILEIVTDLGGKIGVLAAHLIHASTNYCNREYINQDLSRVLSTMQSFGIKIPLIGALFNNSNYSQLPPDIRSTFLNDVIKTLEFKIENDQEMAADNFIAIEEDEKIKSDIMLLKKAAIKLLGSILANDDEEEEEDEMMEVDDEGFFSAGISMELLNYLGNNLSKLLPLLVNKSLEPELKSLATATLSIIYNCVPLDTLDTALDSVEIFAKMILNPNPNLLHVISVAWVTEKKSVNVQEFYPKIAELYLKTTEDAEEDKIHLIRTLGAFATVENALLKEVALFLINKIPRSIDDQNIQLTAEILDCLMDLFAEDETDSVFKEIELLAVFQRVVGVFKSISRLVRDNVVVETVAENVGEFVKYKKKRI